MFDGTFDMARTGPDGMTHVIVRHSWSERESLLVDAHEAELAVFRRWVEFYRETLGFEPSWGTWAC
jgi:hypothetical protein